MIGAPLFGDGCVVISVLPDDVIPDLPESDDDRFFGRHGYSATSITPDVGEIEIRISLTSIDELPRISAVSPGAR